MSDKPPTIPRPPKPPARDAFRIVDLMGLIATLAVGFWLALPMMERRDFFPSAVLLLGAVSAWGPLILILERFRRRRPIRSGKLLWLVTGLAAWMLWPPALVRHVAFQKADPGLSLVCFTYVVPLSGLLLTGALALGGRLHDRKGWRTPWREAFGRWLALAWSSLGVYVLYTLYRGDLFGP